MTNRDELDRVLGDWLSEGPVRAPEPLIGTALQHARSHPRRPDVLGFLRRDPMGTRTIFSSPGFAPVPVMAILGLLLVAALGVSLVGGQRQDAPPPVAPTPAEPSMNPSASPSDGAGPSPSSTPGASVPIRVELETASAAAMVVEVTDASGLLVDARTDTPADGGSVAPGEVSVTSVDERTVLLTWTDSVCDITYALRIETTTSMTLASPTCSGDAMALDRRLVVQFSVPVDAGAVDVQVLQLPAGASAAP